MTVEDTVSSVFSTPYRRWKDLGRAGPRRVGEVRQDPSRLGSTVGELSTRLPLSLCRSGVLPRIPEDGQKDSWCTDGRPVDRGLTGGDIGTDVVENGKVPVPSLMCVHTYSHVHVHTTRYPPWEPFTHRGSAPGSTLLPRNDCTTDDDRNTPGVYGCRR